MASRPADAITAGREDPNPERKTTYAVTERTLNSDNRRQRASPEHRWGYSLHPYTDHQLTKTNMADKTKTCTVTRRTLNSGYGDRERAPNTEGLIQLVRVV